MIFQGLKKQIKTGAHSPGQFRQETILDFLIQNFNKTFSYFKNFSYFRVNGPLKNFREFSQDFNCEIGDPMNPEEKCKVW